MKKEVTHQYLFSLKREFKNKRTILSLVLAFFLLGFFFLKADLKTIIEGLTKADPIFLFFGFFLHYFSYIIRGRRWKEIINYSSNKKESSVVLAKIILISQSIDCVFPAKVGNLYGAHLLKINFDTSFSFGLGSIFLWRLIDAVVLILGVFVCFIFFQKDISIQIGRLITIGAVGVIIVFFVFYVLYPKGKRWIFYLIPESIKEMLNEFEKGININIRKIPLLVFLSLAIWLMEAARLYFVFCSVNHSLPIQKTIFVAWASALATAVPLTPAGLGVVELFLFEILKGFGFESSVSSIVTLLDRTISYWSQIPVGFFVFVFSSRKDIKFWSR